MFLKKENYDALVAELDFEKGEAMSWRESADYWIAEAVKKDVVLLAEQAVHAATEQAVRSAESALRHKEKHIASLEEQVANLVEKKNRHKEEIDQEHRLRNQANNRAEDAEKALADAKRVTFIVTAHRNNAAAAKRFTNLDDAVAEYSRLYEYKVDARTSRPAHYPLCIYALVGDLVVSDVTDPEKWGETLPVSTEPAQSKSKIGVGVYGRAAVWGDLVHNAVRL